MSHDLYPRWPCACRDWRNASLYVPQLDFSAFAGMEDAERQDVWYM